MISNDLTCKEFVEIVTEYLEESLPAEEKQRFEVHLAGCKGCEAYLEQMRQTIHWAGRLTEEQISADAKTILLQTFRDWKEKKLPGV